MSPSAPRILVPLDGSPLAESALPAAAEIASGWGAVVVLLHVLEVRAPETIHGEPHLTDSREAERYLETVAARLRENGVRVELHAHEPGVPDVAEGIAGHAREIGADLIVLCTHGSGGLRDLLLGNIAQQTLRRCTRPVLLVRPPAPEGGWGLGKGPWVVAVDPVRHGPTALPLVALLGKALDTPVTLATVVPTRRTLPADRRAAATLAPGTASSVLKLEERDARDYLEELRKELEEEGVPARTELARGDPVREILRILERDRGTLLVVASHGLAGLSGILSGSFGTGVVGRSLRPILLVHAEEEG